MRLRVFIFVTEWSETDSLPKLDKHYEPVIIRQSEASTFAQLSTQLRKHQPVVLISTGNLRSWNVLGLLPFSYLKRWIHVAQVADIKSTEVIHCYIAATLRKPNTEPPLFSVITPTYHSGTRLLRPLHSLQSQTYRNWEWILWDDSQPEHQECWQHLLQLQNEDIRISCFRADQNSGFIGEMKRRAGSLARGDWIVELDHDDIIDHRLFEWCDAAIKQYPETDFICSDYYRLAEETEAPADFGDHFSLGYGSNIRYWLRGKWHVSQPVSSITPETIRHIVGVPNHVRIWKRSFYERIGRHNSLLPVVDDYELLLRTFLEGNWCRIAYPAYVQFDNAGGNNFTYLRNSLIQHLTREVARHYESQIHEHFNQLTIPDTSAGGWRASDRAWELPNEQFRYSKFFKTFTPLIRQDTTISIILIVEGDATAEIDAILQQIDQDWILYIIGNNSTSLEATMNQLTTRVSSETLTNKIHWWNLARPQGFLARNYALRMLVTTDLVTYATEHEPWTPDRLQTLRTALDGKDHTVIGHNLIHKMSLLERYGKDFTSTQEELVRQWV